jgi:hypothetical protein
MLILFCICGGLLTVVFVGLAVLLAIDFAIDMVRDWKNNR